MNYDQFMGHVQDRAQMAGTDEAVRATRSTLRTLAERITGEQAKNLASQLPEEVAVFLRESAGPPETFDSDAFLQRVSEREGVDLPKSIHHTRVVIEVMEEAVARGEIEKVKSQLTDDYNRIFEAGSAGKMPNV